MDPGRKAMSGFGALCMLLALPLAMVLVLGASGCGGEEGETGLQTTTLATVQGESANTTEIAEPTTVVLTVDQLVGSYTGEWIMTGPNASEPYPLSFVVEADGSMEGTSEQPEGRPPVGFHGNLGAGGSLVAQGVAEGLDLTSTFEGTFKMVGGVVSVEGTWETSSGDSGTWSASNTP